MILRRPYADEGVVGARGQARAGLESVEVDNSQIQIQGRAWCRRIQRACRQCQTQIRIARQLGGALDRNGC